MANTVKVRRSATPSAVPTIGQLALGEIAVNTYDGKLFLKKSVGGVETIVDVTASGSATGTVTSVAALTLGTTGTDVTSTVATGTTTAVITLNIPTASATNRGALSAADWTTFNGKQAAGSYVTVNGALGTPSSGTLTNCTFPTLNQNTTGSSGSCTGNSLTATTLQTARTINGTGFNGSANIDTTEWFHSDRDFPNGTLITTNINYAVSSGDPFVLEIRGNSYGNIIPLDLLYQGYIYADTIINHGGLANGLIITGLVAINVGGNLCFWFPTQGYWNGYNVKVYAAYATRATNRVTSITGTTKPTSTKEVALSANIRQSLHSGNYNSYAPTLTGTGASGSWGISVTGSSASCTGNAATATNVAYSGLTGTVPTWNQNTTGSSASCTGNAATATFATNSSKLYSTDAAYNYNSANPYYGYLSYNGARWRFNVNPASPSAVEVAYADASTTSASCSGNAATATTATSAYYHLSQDRNRATMPTPNSRAQQVQFDFANGTVVGGTVGNFAGIMTWAPYDGNTASTGDASYQIGVTSTAANGGGFARMVLRKGIDSTWNSWQELLSSSNYNSYSPTLTGTGASGSWGISVTGSSASCTGNAATAGGLTGTPSISVASVTTSGTLIRPSPATGYMNGNYTTGESSTTSGCIYTIGGSYVPTTTTLGNMYGIGYGYSTVSGGSTGVGSSIWGMYVASGGTTKVFLDSDNGNGFFTGYVKGTNITSGGNVTGSSASCTGNAASATYAYNCNSWFNFNANYGHAVEGIYSSTLFQGLFDMGPAYRLTAGGGVGNLYGTCWSYPSAGGAAANLDSHGQIVLINGGFGSCMSYSIKASANVTAYSDERLKTNWKPLADNFVEKLANIRVGTYDRTDQSITQVGVSAQSLETLMPEAVITGNDEMHTKSVAYGNAALASAVMLAKEMVEMKSMIEELKAEIATLKGSK